MTVILIGTQLRFEIHLEKKNHLDIISRYFLNIMRQQKFCWWFGSKWKINYCIKQIDDDDVRGTRDNASTYKPLGNVNEILDK